MVVAWLVFATILFLFELHHLAFYALFGAIGALAAAVVAFFAPTAIVAQVAVAIVAALGGVVMVRPFVSRAFASRRGGHVARGVHGGLAGQQAITLDDVIDREHVGHVRLAGERWLAVSGSGERIGAGTPVLVVAVEGTTLVVWPLDGTANGAIVGPGQTGPGERDDAPDGADGRTP
jgi:membrane protein implicated in regulation of membrane protease activity